jgi:hypothetical protein
MALAQLTFKNDEPEQIDAFNDAARKVFDLRPASEEELFGRWKDRGFAVPNGLNNVPAQILSPRGMLLDLFVQMHAATERGKVRGDLHDSIEKIMRHMTDVSARVQALMKRVQHEIALRNASMASEPHIAREVSMEFTANALPPIVGNASPRCTTRESDKSKTGTTPHHRNGT